MNSFLAPKDPEASSPSGRPALASMGEQPTLKLEATAPPSARAAPRLATRQVRPGTARLQREVALRRPPISPVLALGAAVPGDDLFDTRNHGSMERPKELKEVVNLAHSEAIPSNA